MAYRLTLHRGAQLPFIWNVSKHVGDRIDSLNRPTDVNLLKFMFSALLSSGVVPAPPGLLVPMAQDGRFDLALAYRIYRYQFGMHHKCDGVVSPADAKGDVLNTWLIGRLNLTLWMKNKQLWETLPRAPGLDPLVSYELETGKL